MIEVLAAGPWTTVQDGGRPGWERAGVSRGGPVDRFSAAVANRLVGNHPDAALLECTLRGPTLRLTEPTVIALTGGECRGEPGWQSRWIAAGETLALGAVAPGLRAYLAIRGGLDVPVVLGSRSLCALGGFGGGFGRPLREGDRIALAAEVVAEPVSLPWPKAHRPPLRGPWEVRVIAGPHDAAFPAGSLERLCESACRISPRIDRMGMRVTTPALRLHSREILTTAVTEGAVQVTPSGELIILLAEHQSTGGYPVIATVIDADLPLLAQARPGDTIRLRPVGHEEAARARRRLAGWLVRS